MHGTANVNFTHECLQLSIYLFRFSYFMCMSVSSVCVRAHVCASHVFLEPLKAEEGARSPEFEVTDGCELLNGCWELQPLLQLLHFSYVT